jgi:hypothetical protein
MAGSLSMATTAVSSAKVAVVGSCEVSRYNNGPMILAWGTAHIDWGEFFVLSFNLYEEVSAMQIGF